MRGIAVPNGDISCEAEGTNEIVDRISVVSLFAHCHTCADTSDRRAQQESGRARTLWDRYQRRGEEDSKTEDTKDQTGP